jgi:nitroimidazol reductase NimA-like FMN-containing flavoprotein (pyridoxamine 5'-phosphate oxidase superfamily)
MLGILNEKQIEELLKRQVTGRLACHAKGDLYIVPINYNYKDGVIYGHSGPGKKIDMMRENPNVCFEVDETESVFRWHSVIAWGTFEEIKDPDEKQQAMQGLIHRIMPLVDSPADHPSHGITEKEEDIDTLIENIVYKIMITRATGRFERS